MNDEFKNVLIALCQLAVVIAICIFLAWVIVAFTVFLFDSI